MTRYGLMLLISLLGAYDILFGYVQCARLTPSTVGFPWSNTSPPPSQPTFPWFNPSPPPSQPTFPWITPSGVPPMTQPTFPWSTPSPPPMAQPTFPWSTPSPPPMAQPTFPWTTPSPPSMSEPTNPIFPSWPPTTQPNPTFPSFPPFLQPTFPSWPPMIQPKPTFPTFPPFSQPTFPTLPPFSQPITTPSLPPPFGLPTLSGFPTGITFTFANMSQDFYPAVGVKVTWDTKITVEVSIKLLVEAITKPINMIISQFKGGSNNWSMSNNAIANNNQQGFNVGATCMTPGQNRFPIKGLIIAHNPIDAMNTVVTWFTLLFDGWTLEKPFIASIDVTPYSYGAFLTNTSTMPNLNTFCTHPTWLTSIAKKQGQLILA